MNKILASYFYKMFNEVLINYCKNIKIEEYESNKTWTEIISSGETSVIQKVLENLQSRFEDYGKKNVTFKTGREYYHVDNLLWQTLDNGKYNRNGINLYPWKLLVAVEHENNSKEWVDEFVKLAYLNCPLRVLICYAEEKDNEYPKALDVANEVSKYINLDRYINDDQEYLIIFGPTLNSFERENFNVQTVVSKYRAYVYGNGEWKRLEESIK